MTTDFGDSVIDGLASDIRRHVQELRRVRMAGRAAFEEVDGKLSADIEAGEEAIRALQGVREPEPEPTPVGRRGSTQDAIQRLIREHRTLTASSLIDRLVADGASASRQAARASLKTAEVNRTLIRTGDRPLTFECPSRDVELV